MCRTHRSDNKSQWTELKCMLALRESHGGYKQVSLPFSVHRTCVPRFRRAVLSPHSSIFLSATGDSGFWPCEFDSKTGRSASEGLGLPPEPPRICRARRACFSTALALPRACPAPQLPLGPERAERTRRCTSGCAKVELKFGPCRVRLTMSQGLRRAAAPLAPTAEALARLRTAPPAEISGWEVCEKKGRST